MVDDVGIGDRQDDPRPAGADPIVEKGLQVLETATEPRTIVEAGLKWSGGDAWKKLVFTEAQPFLSEEAESKWTEGKQTYRQLREEGKV